MRPSSARQRQRILDAATRKFAEDGFSGARVDDIASSAGVNKRLLYHYVGAKAELFAAALQWQAQHLQSSSLSSEQVWALILEEAAHADGRVLFDALVAFESKGNPRQVHARLAQAMFTALLPAAASLGDVEDREQSAGHSEHKPRLRMMPQVIASADESARSPANRSK